MRWIALVVIALSLPAFIAWLSQSEARRNQALMAIGVMVFFAGSLQIDASPISWPMWAGTVRGISISPIDTLALALIVTRRRSSRGMPLLPLLAIYCLPTVASLAVAAVPMATSFVIFQLLCMIVLFIAVGGELARPGALRGLLVGLSLGLMLQAGFVIEQKLSGVVQATGTLDHQNVLGMMVELSILPLIAAVMEGERHKLIYAGILGGLIAVAGGGSRGTMAFLASGIVILVLLSLIRRATPRKFQMLGMGVLAAAVVVPLSLATLEDRFGDSSLVTQESERAAFEEAARAMSADHPFGVGANLYVTVANTEGYAARAGVAWNEFNRRAPVHNAYLLARAETGWAGEVMLWALLLIPAGAGIRLAFARRKGAAEGIALGSAVALMAIAAHNTVEFAWHTSQSQTVFFLNLAIIGGCIRAARIDKLARRRAVRAESDRQDHDRGPVPQMASRAGSKLET